MDASNETYQHHISSRFNDDLEQLRKRMLEMGGLVERQVNDATNALMEGNSELAANVIEREKDVNQCEVNIDKDCTRILALQNPQASDLRLLLSINRGTTDLERIGDESQKIAKMALRLSEEGKSPRGYVEVRHITLLVRQMLADALDCYARLDVNKAIEVAQQDLTVDQEYKLAMRALVTYMMEDARSISLVFNIIWSLRALERIGDHANNLAEQVIYMVKGYDIRHLPIKDVAEKIQREK